MEKRILILAPHADDIEIAMGGTISRQSAVGAELKIVTAIIPCEYADGKADETFKESRFREAREAAGLMGAELENLDIDSYDFQFNRSYVKLFDGIIRDYSPDEVFTCWEYDSHQDHRTLARITYSVTRKNRSSLYMYETMVPGGISSHAFNPQLFVDISDVIDVKRKAIECYRSVFPKDSDIIDAVISRARFRGQQIGVRYAEAFEIVKEVRY